MATTIKRVGFGQVEPNHLSSQATGVNYAQLPAAAAIKIMENGQFAKYDYATNGGEVNYTGKGEWMLVFNEIKLYEGSKNTRKDFAMKASNFTDGKIYSRLVKTNVGDIYTTNCVGAANTAEDAEYAGVSLAVGDLLKVAATGYLVKETAALDASTEAMLWQVVKEYTMPDGQPGIKIMRIK